MPYVAQITRNNPTMILFLLDQSASMQEEYDLEHTGTGPTKAQGVADAINKLLQILCIRCAKEDGIRDYFHVGVLGYGAQIGPAFVGNLAGKDLVPISEVGTTPARLENRTKKVPDGAGGLVDQLVKFPIWFDPMANGSTPMCAALKEANRICQNWLSSHPDCYPPIIINITDGESSDGDPSTAAFELRKLASNDGGVLLLNLHLSSLKARSIEFPSTEIELPDQYAKLLFNMSSLLAPSMITQAKSHGYNLHEGARGFAFNAKLDVAIQFLDIGTYVATTSAPEPR